MSGKYSRNKGKRAEYQVRDIIREMGYQAERVPLSGASNAMKGDVVVIRQDGSKFFIEVKSHAYIAGYDLIFNILKLIVPAWQFSNAGQCYQVSFSLLFPTAETIYFLSDTKESRAVVKLVNKWLQGADYLAVKKDRHPFIWIKRI